MLIVTPAPGQWSEPRPKSLITGDRAVTVLDTASAAALQTAGVKVASVTGSTYSKLISELTPEVMEGIDETTGKLKTSVMPTYLSPAAIAEVDIRGTDGKIQEQYLPTRLSAASLNAQLSSSGGTSTSSATMTTANISTAVITNATISAGTVTDLTSTNSTTSKQSFQRLATPPANPTGDKVVQYVDANGRMAYRTDNGQTYRASNKRFVDAFPGDSDSQLGDEVILNSTGEHRMYYGAAKGWRHVTKHYVSSLAERNALTNKYTGMTVYCDFGFAQDQIYTAGKDWRGTQPYKLQVTDWDAASGVNDTNWRKLFYLDVIDPGYDYLLQGVYNYEVQCNAGGVVRAFSKIGSWDYKTTVNWKDMGLTYQSAFAAAKYRAMAFNHSFISPYTLQGSRTIAAHWMVDDNAQNARASSMNGALQFADVFVVPA